jgi:hypothetical protein
MTDPKDADANQTPDDDELPVGQLDGVTGGRQVIMRPKLTS